MLITLYFVKLFILNKKVILHKLKTYTMKKSIYGILIGMGLTTLVSFTSYNYVLRNNTSEVDQLQGYYIFVNSKPVMEYKYLGTVKCVLPFGISEYSDIRDRLIKKATKDYPQADGLIFTFKNKNSGCDAIKFK